MKNYYMVQASTTYGGNLFKAAYLPYAAGLLVARANEDKSITSSYEFKRFIFTREDINEAVASLDEPFLVGFSCYIWNTEYNKALAKAIKAKYPNCYIVFGGHNVPPDEAFLRNFGYIDFLIHSEGEEAFSELLIQLNSSSPDFSKVSNLSWRQNGEFFSTKVKMLTRLDYPSPYLTGVFDKILADYPDMQHDAILETSRGCPRNCAYCDWGCTNSKVKLFPIERIKAEIDWFASHKVAFLWGADANFGAFSRDMEIVDYLVETRKRTGLPERLRTNYAKDKDETILEISRKLDEYGLSKEGATLSFQSLNPDTLNAIGRKNMTMERFQMLLSRYKAENITTYSELILGLPEETYKSFCEGIGKLLEAGQHRLINVYNCELLPNSLMGSPEYMQKYGIKVADVEFLAAHSSLKNEITERTKYVIATNTMNCSEWIKANIFACFEKSFHHYGVLRFFAIYMFKQKHMKYEDFYNAVIDQTAAKNGTLNNFAYNFLYNFYRDVTESKPIKLYSNPLYGKITWEPEHVPQLIFTPELDRYYSEMTPFFLSLGIDEQILDELIRYQKCNMKLPGKNHFSDSFCYNWHEFFEAVYLDKPAKLIKHPNTVFVNNEKHPESWQEYAIEAAWFGKNGTTFNPGITVTYND